MDVELSASHRERLPFQQRAEMWLESQIFTSPILPIPAGGDSLLLCRHLEAFGFSDGNQVSSVREPCPGSY